MKKRIKIWYHAGSTSDIREFSINKTLLGLPLLILVLVITGLTFIGHDYLRLKKLSFNTKGLNETILAKNNEIKSQRGQIQDFVHEINGLKKQVHNLSLFEDKIRIIADIQQTSDSSGFIGIGGIPKEKLDPDIPLDQKHNNLMREMHSQVAATNLATKKQALNFENLIKMLEQKRNFLASTPSIRPVDGWISSRFGYRKSPFTGKKEFHSGLDIANKSGTKVIAPANGKVSYAAKKMYFGNLIIIDHGHKRITKYGHLKKILVKRGQQVKRGDVIAILGNTGRSTGPHVHYEVRINGTPVNPLKYILN